MKGQARRADGKVSVSTASEINATYLLNLNAFSWSWYYWTVAVGKGKIIG